MKAKLFLFALTGLFIVSCSSKKTAVAEKEKPKGVVMTTELTAGKSLYEQSCVKCHKLYEPKSHTKEDWAPILVKMQKKAHLNDEQIASISNYITSQL